MPIYEYGCTIDSCGHELEALQKMADEPLLYCPACGEASLKKKISAAAFRLKGSGWYETDFKNSGKKDDKKSSDTSAASTESKKESASTSSDSSSKVAVNSSSSDTSS